MISTSPDSLSKSIKEPTDVSTLARRTRFLWVLGVVFALSGQVILLRTQGNSPREGLMQAVAGSLLILGACLFGAFAKPVISPTARFDFPKADVTASTFTWRRLWVLGSLLTSILLAALAIFLFIEFGESTSVVLIWIASIILLFVASLGNLQIARPRLPHDWMYLAALAGLLVIAAWMRIYKLGTLPFNFDGDFASVGLEARALLTGQYRNIFAFGWADIPILGYFPPYLSMRVFGDNLVGLNASGVIEGLLVILGVYLLGRDLFHARVGLLAAALLTISYAHLAASRQATYIDPVLLLVYIVYFLLLGLREGRAWAIVLSGVLTALCLQVYYSGRIIVFIVGFLLFFLWLFQRSTLKKRGWAVLLWGLAVLIALGPMLVAFAKSPTAFVSRSQEVFILAPEVVRHMEGVFQVNTVPAMLLQQARRTALTFHYYPDTGTQFGMRKPFLDPFTAILFTLGSGYAIFHSRKTGNALMLAWTVIGLVLGCFLTVNPPFWARLMILLPPAALLAALGLDLIYQQIHRGFQTIEPHAGVLAPILVMLLIGVVGVVNWNTYVNLKGTFGTARTYIGRYLADQPASTRAYLISTNYNYQDREFEFLAPGRLVANIPPEQIEANTPLSGEAKIIILAADQAQLLGPLQQRFPNATVETHMGNAPNEIVFYAIRIP